MAAWGVQLAKIIWFRSFEDPFSAPQLYQIITGSEPDTSQVNRIVSHTQPFNSHASGTVDGVTYVTAIQVGRLELQIAKPDSTPGIPSRWSIEEATDIVFSALHRADQNTLSQCNRLAVNLLSNIATGNQPDSASEVLTAAGITLDLPSPIDLQF